MDRSEIPKLSVEGRIELIEKIWESMPFCDHRPIPDWHLELVRERLAEYRASGKRGEPAVEAIERICRNL